MEQCFYFLLIFLWPVDCVLSWCGRKIITMVMITEITWITWTLMSAVQERLLNLSPISLTCRYKYILKNTKIYFHFLSFLTTDMVMVFIIFMLENKSTSILHTRFHCCLWSDDKSQVLSTHYVALEFSQCVQVLVPKGLCDVNCVRIFILAQ